MRKIWSDITNATKAVIKKDELFVSFRNCIVADTRGLPRLSLYGNLAARMRMDDRIAIYVDALKHNGKFGLTAVNYLRAFLAAFDIYGVKVSKGKLVGLPENCVLVENKLVRTSL